MQRLKCLAPMLMTFVLAGSELVTGENKPAQAHVISVVPVIGLSAEAHVVHTPPAAPKHYKNFGLCLLDKEKDLLKDEQQNLVALNNGITADNVDIKAVRTDNIKITQLRILGKPALKIVARVNVLNGKKPATPNHPDFDVIPTAQSTHYIPNSYKVVMDIGDKYKGAILSCRQATSRKGQKVLTSPPSSTPSRTVSSPQLSYN